MIAASNVLDVTVSLLLLYHHRHFAGGVTLPANCWPFSLSLSLPMTNTKTPLWCHCSSLSLSLNFLFSALSRRRSSNFWFEKPPVRGRLSDWSMCARVNWIIFHLILFSRLNDDSHLDGPQVVRRGPHRERRRASKQAAIEQLLTSFWFQVAQTAELCSSWSVGG